MKLVWHCVPLINWCCVTFHFSFISLFLFIFFSFKTCPSSLYCYEDQNYVFRSRFIIFRLWMFKTSTWSFDVWGEIFDVRYRSVSYPSPDYWSKQLESQWVLWQNSQISSPLILRLAMAVTRDLKGLVISLNEKWSLLELYAVLLQLLKHLLPSRNNLCFPKIVLVYSCVSRGDTLTFSTYISM